MSNPALEMARECFLSMIAEARTWRENVDGDTDANGHTVMYIDYDLNVRHRDLEEFCDALGIPRAWDETVKDAIDRELALPSRAAVSAQSEVPGVLAPVVHVAAATTQPSGQPDQVQADPNGSLMPSESPRS